ncbi:MAG: hypothetical protein A2731_01505 [Candidatus Buchananbacteria bacterium RIFCSPHIGHO2_01_FULL_39_8]|uniref:Uncharacterized protein n=1 Tax=Candidatus Buchananbacteria bacterium RIFCSPHIGHO2_01_FULL_39_8 TaxID=1797533 RepID=A0A1G1Y2Y2_9BACT|nr:MAG: hypothetical protein A2731_01505 [Candidatus Buchananbacteria bacterium RIFCSPHIGHO2_01_FULL_39_8]
MAADEININVDPMGNLLVFARSVTTLETENQIRELDQRGMFGESSRVFGGDPIQIIGPGIVIENATNL